MQKCVVILLALGASISGYVVRINQQDVQPRIAPSLHLQRHKQVLELFENVCENYTSNAYVGQIIPYANDFSITELLAGFGNNEITEKFKRFYETNSFMLTGEIFSEHNTEHMEELKVIYGMFYHATSFDDFYKIACWAKHNINCEIFVDALYGAILNRKDTENMKVPPPYEILPNYFIRRDALAKAVLVVSNKDVVINEDDGIHKEGNVYTVDANYTGNFYENNEESKLAYFREDVGLNTFYYFFLLRNAYWVNNVNNDGTSTSEYIYYITRQLNARYNLERITNGLDGIEESVNIYNAAGYDPMLMYTDGSYFPERMGDISAYVDLFSEAQSKIKTKIQNLAVVNKPDLLDAVVEALTPYFCHNNTSGQNLITTTRLPSAVDHYMTSLRDPAYWRLLHQHLLLFNEALNVLEPYDHNQIYFPGVEIMNIEVKKMQTYCEYTEMDITSSVSTDVADNLIDVKIAQPRLNHKPFSILINVSSLVSQKALVKIFIGPRFKPSEIHAMKDLLKQLDTFEYTLKVGNNKIVRKSEQIDNIVNDLSSLKSLKQMIENAQQAFSGIETFILNHVEPITGFPSRLVLPKGTVEGFPLQLYVMILPLKTHRMDNKQYSDVFSFGYPFDRKIVDPKLFDLENTMFKDILITHKGDNKIYNYGGEGASRKWYTGGSESYRSKDLTYDYQSKKSTGEYNYKEKQKSGSYDYQSKKEKYGKKKYDFPNEKNYNNKLDSEEVPLEVVPLDQFHDVTVIPIATSTNKNGENTQTNHYNDKEDMQMHMNQPKNINKQFTPLLQLKSPYKDSKYYDKKSSKNSAEQHKKTENSTKTEKNVGSDSKEEADNEYRVQAIRSNKNSKDPFHYDYQDKLNHDKVKNKMVKKTNKDNKKLCEDCYDTIPQDEKITWVNLHDPNHQDSRVYY